MELEEYVKEHANELIKRLIELFEYQNNVKIKYTIEKFE